MDELTFAGENDMDGHVVKHDQMISNVVQIGKIVKPEKDDPKPPKGSATVLVHIGGEEEGTYTRNWMPWVTARAGYDAEWWQPELNEQVVVVAPSGNLALGIIIGMLFRGDWLSLKASDSQDAKPEVGLKTPAEAKQHIYQRLFADGSEVSFDKKKHLFSMLFKSKPDAKKAATSISITAKEKKGEISVICGEEESDQTTIELKSGSLSLTSAKDFSLTVEEEKIEVKKDSLAFTSAKNICLTADDSKLEMKSGAIALESTKELSLTVGGSKIEMKKDKIVLKSKTVELDAGTKLVVNSSGADVS